MRKILYILTFLTLLAPIGMSAFDLKTTKNIKHGKYGSIDAKGLKALMDAEVSFVLLDARGLSWKDPHIIPGAKLASDSYLPEEIEALIPAPSCLIVIYCYSSLCPLSNRLAEYLFHLGYPNIITYPGGLTDWRDKAGFPIEIIER